MYSKQGSAIITVYDTMIFPTLPFSVLKILGKMVVFQPQT